jgi:hypothetical protein
MLKYSIIYILKPIFQLHRKGQRGFATGGDAKERAALILKYFFENFF